MENDEFKNSDINEDASSVSIKEVLGETLNRQFNSDEDALKSVKEAQDMIGSFKGYEPIKEMVNTIAKDKGISTEEAISSLITGSTPKDKSDITGSNPDDYVRKADLDERDFYSQNPTYSPYKDIIKAIMVNKKMGINEAVNSPELKTALDKLAAHDRNEGMKSVITSSPHLKNATNKLKDASNIYGKAKQENRDMSASEKEKAESLATQAVLDAFPRDMAEK